MTNNDITIPVGQLRAFTARNFEALGMAPEHAELMAEQIAWAHIRGYPWLGARKIIQYGTRIMKGVAATHGNLNLVTETDSLAAFDADNAFSQVIGKRARGREGVLYRGKLPDLARRMRAVAVVQVVAEEVLVVRVVPRVLRVLVGRRIRLGRFRRVRRVRQA